MQYAKGSFLRLKIYTYCKGRFFIHYLTMYLLYLLSLSKKSDLANHNILVYIKLLNCVVADLVGISSESSSCLCYIRYLLHVEDKGPPATNCTAHIAGVGRHILVHCGTGPMMVAYAYMIIRPMYLSREREREIT